MSTKKGLVPSGPMPGAFVFKDDVSDDGLSLTLQFHAQVGGNSKLFDTVTRWHVQGAFRVDDELHFCLVPRSQETPVTVIAIEAERTSRRAMRVNFLSPSEKKRRSAERNSVTQAGRRARLAGFERGRTAPTHA